MTTLPAKKVTISGSFYINKENIESYTKVTGVIPGVDEDKAAQMVNKRYAKMWLETAKDEDGNRLPRVHRVREVFIDHMESGEEEFSYVGKDIMEMSFPELQDLATAKDLRAIPLYKSGSLVLARRIAFSAYAIKVLGQDAEELDYRKEGFNPNVYAPIKPDAALRRDGDAPVPIEESIDRQQLVLNKQLTPSAADGTSKLTMPQLQEIARQKKIDFSPGMPYPALYKKVYGHAVGAAA